MEVVARAIYQGDVGSVAIYAGDVLVSNAEWDGLGPDAQNIYREMAGPVLDAIHHYTQEDRG